MTVAVCCKCGAFKDGAWTTCPKCGSMPATDDEIAISFAMTDHHFDLDTLKQMASDTKRNGEPPHLLPAQKAQLLDQVRKIGILSQMKKDAAAANRRGRGCLLAVLFFVPSIPVLWMLYRFLPR